MLTNPFQIVESGRRLMVPELRVSCVECGKPIPYVATTCPFCGAAQPENTIAVKADKDRDGMPDEWEVKYGFDPLNPADASQDADHDNFTNLEEYQAGTNPRDPNDFPPPIVKLRVVKIEPQPFPLLFMAVNRFTNKQVFQLNLGTGGKTYWVELGQEVQGFKVVGYKEKIREVKEGRVSRRVDESELTLQSGNETIILIKGQKYPYQKYVAHFVFTADNSEHAVKGGDVLELQGRKYQVKDIDTKQQRVLIADTSTAKETWIGPQAASEGVAPAATGGSAPVSVQP